ncbi:MAG: hypothetical protein NTV04_11355 [Deltaproteobacteria bacterium]|nr:hypothetical protein [Deltaproteobacteria bacterium]
MVAEYLFGWFANRPYSFVGRPQDTPTIETIVWLTFYEVISIDLVKKGKALKNF